MDPFGNIYQLSDAELQNRCSQADTQTLSKAASYHKRVIEVCHDILERRGVLSKLSEPTEVFENVYEGLLGTQEELNLNAIEIAERCRYTNNQTLMDLAQKYDRIRTVCYDELSNRGLSEQLNAARRKQIGQELEMIPPSGPFPGGYQYQQAQERFKGQYKQ